MPLTACSSNLPIYNADSYRDLCRQFASFARKTSSTLQCIKIQFQPDACEIGYEEEAKDRIYPWDLMDDIQDTIRSLGLSLSYARPTLSKEEFEKRVRGFGERISQTG